MKRVFSLSLAGGAMLFLLAGLTANGATTDPQVIDSEFLGPFTGADAPLDPANVTPENIGYYGTDLGWSYEHDGQIHFMFGDTWSTESYAPINGKESPLHDDVFGTVSLAEWPDGSRIKAGNIPTINLAQDPETKRFLAFDPGHAMDLGKTPIGGFSDGEHEYGLFLLVKGKACQARSDCTGGMSCDTTLGTLGASLDEQAGTTLACLKGTPYCTGANHKGICTDPRASIAGPTTAGKIASAAMTLRFGRKSDRDPAHYIDTADWVTTKFMNSAIRAVRRFEPDSPAGWDFSSPSSSDSKVKIFYFGRPSFIGVGAVGRPASLYFAYSSIPDAEHGWNRRYYYGTGKDGKPEFGPDESRASPVSMATDEIDIVNQMSVVWLEQIGKWMMVYGGGVTDIKSAFLPKCGLLQLFAGTDCDQVNMNDRSIVVRFADNPWGPWSGSQTMMKVEGPEKGPSGQYGPGGSLRHPACQAANCAPHSRADNYHEDEYGFLYGVNVIEPWTSVNGSELTIVWNASTWDPYRVGLYRTRFRIGTD